MKNQSRAAAQTASIGNQDMMTFIPGPPMEGGGNGTQQMQQQLNSTTVAQGSATGRSEGGGSNSSGAPEPLRAQNRGESMDDDAFNASLDALLKEVNSDSYGSTPPRNLDVGGGFNEMMGSSAQSSIGDTTDQDSKHEAKQSQLPSSIARMASVTASSMTASSSDTAAAVAPPAPVKTDQATMNLGAALHHHHHHRQHQHHSFGGQASVQPQHQQQGQQQQSLQQQHQNPNHIMQHQPQSQLHMQLPPPQNFSAQGLVQLPQMFSSQPISVAAGAPGSMSLLGSASFGSGVHFTQANSPAVAAGTGTSVTVTQPSPSCLAQHYQQQSQQQQLQFHASSLTMPQHQMSLQGHLNGAGGSIQPNAVSAGLMPQLTQQSNESQLYQLPSASAFGQVQSSQWPAVASLGFPSQATISSQAPTPLQGVKDSNQNKPTSAVSKSSLSPPPVRSARAAASGNATSSGLTVGSTTKRKRASLTVSEDEDEKKKRRSERNLREQERSHRITERIADLRKVLAEAGVHFKPDRYSTLVSVVGYIKQLQSRSQSLDEEHRKLLDTIAGADRLVKNRDESLENNNNGTTTVQTHLDVGENVSATSSDSNNDDEFLVFVQGIDYKFIFASCGVALAIASVDGRFVDCNDEFLRITNYTRDEVMGGHRQSSQPAAASPSGGVVTVSTSTSCNSSALTTAAAAAAAAVSKSPEAPHSSPHVPSTGELLNLPPPEIHTRKQHLSLFNLLGRKDMETVYAAMSHMLKASTPHPSSGAKSRVKDEGGATSSASTVPRSSSSDSLTRSTEESSSGNDVGGELGRIHRYTVDHWSGKVKHMRRKNQMLQLNISLVRTLDGRPKYFNCALSEAEPEPSGSQVSE